MVEENFQFKRSQMHQNKGFFVKSHSVFHHGWRNYIWGRLWRRLLLYSWFEMKAFVTSGGAHLFWRRPVIMASPITSRGANYSWVTNYFWHNYYFWGRSLLLASSITSRGAHYYWGHPLQLASSITSRGAQLLLASPITSGGAHYFWHRPLVLAAPSYFLGRTIYFKRRSLF